jgi:bifunctional enzyme Fae/Hps
LSCSIAVAKAVADSVVGRHYSFDIVGDWVIIAAFLFIHKKDARESIRILWRTNMAIQRALNKYPSIDKINYDKDRAKHPIMGFKVPRLWRPPYLQIALDAPDLEGTKRVISQLPGSDRIILEVGTPLIKRYGTRVIGELRQAAKDKSLLLISKPLT